ncbi:MAG: DUF4426 domain-containing protein [Wenzhouxiangellaceae bacterium]|nr:MAG: DUF4426 domain-containing protein [Wenzhouxiangellaceae bacterium]
MRLKLRPELILPGLLLLAFAMTSPPALSGQYERFGPYAIHYNTFNTNQLTPDVARSYGIQRSANRALLNIAVLRTVEDGLDIPVTARVTATTTNLAGQRRELEMVEVRDQDAIYYIGSFRIHGEETLTFRLSVQPEEQGRSHEFSFRQQLYAQ